VTGTILALTWRSFRRHKRAHRASTVAVAVSTVLILVFLAVGKGAGDVMMNEAEQNPGLREIQIGWGADLTPGQTSGGKATFEPGDIPVLKGGNDAVRSVTVSSRTDGTIERCALDGRAVAPPDALQGIDPHYDTFDAGTVQVATTAHPGANAIMAGRSFTAPDTGAALIADTSVLLDGKTDLTGIVGSILTCSVGEIDVSMTIVGVYWHLLGSSSALDVVEGTRAVSPAGLPFLDLNSLLVTRDVVADLNGAGGNAGTAPPFTTIALSMDDMTSTLSLCRELANQYNNQIACDIDGINRTQQALTLLGAVMASVGGVLVVLAASNTFAATVLAVERKRKWLGLQLVIGFERRHVTLVTAGETVLSVVVGFGVGLICAIVSGLGLGVALARHYAAYMAHARSAFLPSAAAGGVLLAVWLVFVVMVSVRVAADVARIDPVSVLSR